MELGDEIFYRLSREDTIVEVGGGVGSVRRCK